MGCWLGVLMLNLNHQELMKTVWCDSAAVGFPRVTLPDFPKDIICTWELVSW